MKERPIVLITGGAGRVARWTAPLLGEAFRLRRLDLADQEDARFRRSTAMYGATKLFGEGPGRYYAGNGMGVVSIRLGGVAPRDEVRVRDDEWFRSLWCAPDDLARLFIVAIDSDVTHATVSAVSPPATERFDTANPFGWAST